MLNSKQIGNITEMETMLAFLKLGYNVLTPYGDCERYDFVADINGKFYKIQCKTSHIFGEDEGIEFSCRSSHRAEGKCINERYSADDVDFFATTYNGKCYLIPFADCGGSKKLRFVTPKNGQINRISFAKDYELEVIISTL
jgi:hypothetical protein